jgi:hypothetical protein
VIGARHAVILPPPKAAPPASEERAVPRFRETLSHIDWACVPEEVVVEIHYLLEFRCRKTSGECFCGEHTLVSQATSG